MKLFSKQLSALAKAIALASFSGLVAAQSLDPRAINEAGLRAAEMIDAGRTTDIWDGASSVARTQVTRLQFVQDVNSARRPLGLVSSRDWRSITRSTSAGTPQLPAGEYVNVEYLSIFASGKAARELVSFHLDEDKLWRFSGYVLR